MDAATPVGRGKPVSVFEREDIDFAAMERDYADRSIKRSVLYARYHICASTLSKIVGRYGWPQRSPRRIDRDDLIQRLFFMLENHLAFLEEKDMKDVGTAEVAVLGKLVSTLDRLIEIKDAETAKKSAARPPRQTMSAIKVKLLKRIEQLKRG